MQQHVKQQAAELATAQQHAADADAATVSARQDCDASRDAASAAQRKAEDVQAEVQRLQAHCTELQHALQASRRGREDEAGAALQQQEQSEAPAGDARGQAPAALRLRAALCQALQCSTSAADAELATQAEELKRCADNFWQCQRALAGLLQQEHPANEAQAWPGMVSELREQAAALSATQAQCAQVHTALQLGPHASAEDTLAAIAQLQTSAASAADLHRLLAQWLQLPLECSQAELCDKLDAQLERLHELTQLRSQLVQACNCGASASDSDLLHAAMQLQECARAAAGLQNQDAQEPSDHSAPVDEHGPSAELSVASMTQLQQLQADVASLQRQRDGYWAELAEKDTSLVATETQLDAAHEQVQALRQAVLDRDRRCVCSQKLCCRSSPCHQLCCRCHTTGTDPAGPADAHGNCTVQQAPPRSPAIICRSSSAALRAPGTILGWHP